MWSAFVVVSILRLRHLSHIQVMDLKFNVNFTSGRGYTYFVWVKYKSINAYSFSRCHASLGQTQRAHEVCVHICYLFHNSLTDFHSHVTIWYFLSVCVCECRIQCQTKSSKILYTENISLVCDSSGQCIVIRNRQGMRLGHLWTVDHLNAWYRMVGQRIYEVQEHAAVKDVQPGAEWWTKAAWKPHNVTLTS